MENALLESTAQRIIDTDAIIVTAGAGMGVDSGLPDFRGDKGFWNAYPMYEKLGLNFVDCANPVHFERDPAFAWGFYGHRLNLYRKTTPHEGFRIILTWISRMSKKYFVVTSNVDGHFQKAGFGDEHIYEIHGSIHYLQCIYPCSRDIWENNEEIEVDFDTMRAKNIPKCIHCKGIARPNILMFGDYGWIPDRSDRQEMNFNDFLNSVKNDKIVILEIGAGTAIPTIRNIGERISSRYDGYLIRINVREPYIPSFIGAKGSSFSENALNVLKKLDNIIYG